MTTFQHVRAPWQPTSLLGSALASRRLSATLRVATPLRESPSTTDSSTQHHNKQNTALQTASHSRGNYPFIDTAYPGVELVHAEPPVYVVHNFLQPGHCHALQQAALAGNLPTAAYNDAVLFDYQRLAYLGFVVAIGAASQAMLAWQAGGDVTSILLSAAKAAAGWAGATALLAVGVKTAVEWYTNGKCFTGSKWSTQQMAPGNPAAEATDAFVNNVCRLLQTDPSKLEVPLVTR